MAAPPPTTPVATTLVCATVAITMAVILLMATSRGPATWAGARVRVIKVCVMRAAVGGTPASDSPDRGVLSPLPVTRVQRMVMVRGDGVCLRPIPITRPGTLGAAGCAGIGRDPWHRCAVTPPLALPASLLWMSLMPLWLLPLVLLLLLLLPALVTLITLLLQLLLL